MRQCKERNQQETPLAAVAEDNAREQQTGKYNYICHNHIRNHLADDECAFADRGDIDLLDSPLLLLPHYIQRRKESAHHGHDDDHQRRKHEQLIIQIRIEHIGNLNGR